MPQPEIDEWLGVVLDWAAKGTLRGPVTVIVGGLLIGGTPISGKEYFELLGEQIQDSLVGERATEGREFFRQWFAEHSQTEEEGFRRRLDERRQLAKAPLPDDDPSEGQRKERANTLAELARSYIMLQDVTITGASTESIRTPLWRGRLTEVSGWHLGQLVITRR